MIGLIYWMLLSVNKVVRSMLGKVVGKYGYRGITPSIKSIST